MLASRKPYIRCCGISKSFGAVKVIEDLDLDVYPGEFISLLGPSGSGKTTLLTLIAGFEHPTSGEIRLDDNRIDTLAPYRREMGVVFQNYALFPHMTVAQNVGFPLRMRHVPRAQIRERVGRALEMVELRSLAERHPAQLSGGQQQRVALARALIFEPRVVLMDEPLGALDKRLREQMQLDIRELHRKLMLTVIFVTHDQSEALTMSDRIAIFNQGKIEQIDTPSAVYDHPRTRFVAEFIGETNLLEGRVKDSDGTSSVIELDQGARIVVSQKLATGCRVSLSVRPERLLLGDAKDLANRISCTISDRVYMGDHLRLALNDGHRGLIVRAPRQADSLDVGDRVTVSFAPADCWALAQ